MLSLAVVFLALPTAQAVWKKHHRRVEFQSNSTSEVDALPQCPAGTILLSLGRTGTGTLSWSVDASTSMNLCGGYKEFYNDHNSRTHGVVSKESMERCMAEEGNHGGVFVHVKPEHITKERDAKEEGELLDPEGFFRAMKEAGFNHVVINFRDNLLAREVSSYELHTDPEETETYQAHSQEDIDALRKQYFLDVDLPEHFEMLTKRFNRCVKAAKAVGFPITAFTFPNLVGDLCGAVKNIVNDAAVHSKESAKGECQAPEWIKCQTEVIHMDSSHRAKTLDERVGKEAADYIRKGLKGTSYEWMLDMSKQIWPEDVKRPIDPILA